MNETIVLNDDSGDKKYFTQLPNVILNHSTANDQALYWQMKRFAGEKGQCFATQETLMQKMKIGKVAYKKSLNYLLKKGWIKFIGMTDGKTRPIKTYSVVDIWKLNIMEYEKIWVETEVSKKIQAETAGDKGQNGSKIQAETAIEEYPTEEYLIKKRESTPSQINKQFFSLFESNKIKESIELLSDNWKKKLAEIPEQNKPAILKELNKFVSYWTEPNKSGTRKQWEIKPTFEINRRLNTWFSRASTFQKQKKSKIINLNNL